MRRKKLVGMLLVSTMIATMLAGCGDKGTQPAETSVGDTEENGVRIYCIFWCSRFGN